MSLEKTGNGTEAERPTLHAAIAASLIDRVLHHCHLVNIRGSSYRMPGHSKHYRALQPDAGAPDAVRRTRRSRAAGH